MFTDLLTLASGSPRRSELLAEFGYNFQVIPPSPNAECGMCSGENPVELVLRLAEQKAADVANQIPAGMVLAADTVAHCFGQILGKPRDRDHAKAMLLHMSDRVHQVYTGVCLWHRPSNLILREAAKTDLKMEPLSEEQLEDYLETMAWEGKAGAFGFQDGLDWVHIVDGEETNVVGLPMPLLSEMLETMQTALKSEPSADFPR